MYIYAQGFLFHIQHNSTQKSTYEFVLVLLRIERMAACFASENRNRSISAEETSMTGSGRLKLRRDNGGNVRSSKR